MIIYISINSFYSYIFDYIVLPVSTLDAKKKIFFHVVRKISDQETRFTQKLFTCIYHYKNNSMFEKIIDDHHRMGLCICQFCP